jgi:hypothetical protein
MKNKIIKEIEIDKETRENLPRFAEIYEKINELVRRVNENPK